MASCPLLFWRQISTSVQLSIFVSGLSRCKSQFFQAGIFSFHVLANLFVCSLPVKYTPANSVTERYIGAPNGTV